MNSEFQAALILNRLGLPKLVSRQIMKYLHDQMLKNKTNKNVMINSEIKYGYYIANI